MFTCLHVDRDMYVSLEEAISCPPPLFSTSSKSEKDMDNTEAKKSAASGPSDVKKDVLYGWCDRPTIHSFMDTVLSLSLRKKQQELMQQQIQEQEQKQKQEQLQYLKLQMKQQKQQQFQQQNNPLSLFSENLQSKGLSKETISQSQSIPGDVHLQEVSQRRPKVKKVMKGGVLVTMPCGPRQPTIGGRPNFETSNNAEKNQLPFSNYKDMTNNFGAGNILDDILARAKDGSCTPSFTKMSQAQKKWDAVGDTGEICLGHESDSSVSSGEFQPTTNITNTNFNPANKTPKYEQSFEKSCGKPSLESFTCTSSDSSCDDQILSSFDRIRSLRFQNENVFSNKAETSEGQSSKQAVPASTGFFKGTSSSLVDEDEIPLKKLQETLLAEERTNPNNKPSVKQQNKDMFSEKPKVVIGMETSAQKIDADCKMTQTKGGNDGMLQNTSMLGQTQSPETMRMDKIKELKENDKKRKEILDETSSSIETKEKRMKEAEKNINSVRITRSMSHGSTEKLPTDTKTQRSRTAKSFPRNNEPTCSMEISEDVPSLLSMVSDEVLDVTVVEKELLRKKSSGGRKKKKRNKPTEWFLRKMAKEKELRNNIKPPEFIPPVCFYFSKGTCAKGSMCQFKHEKTKELCGYYAGSGECYKFQDGMCPNMHSEFPCKFFHIQKFCWNEDNCWLSHEPLTEETRDVLDNHLLTIQQRNKQGNTGTKALESSSSITEKSEMNEKCKEICPVDKTGGRLSSNLIVPAPIIPVKQLPPANTLKYPVPTEHSGKSINSPKVKRLCSLSSYKPQILSSLTTIIKSFELSSPKDKIPSECNPKDSPQMQDVKADDTKLQFLPGIFKER